MLYIDAKPAGSAHSVRSMRPSVRTVCEFHNNESSRKGCRCIRKKVALCVCPNAHSSLCCTDRLGFGIKCLANCRLTANGHKASETECLAGGLASFNPCLGPAV